MLMTTYLDESGHSKDPACDFVGMSGMIAGVDKWKVFESDWAGMLRDFDIPFVHRSELAHSMGPFKGWDEIKRRKLVGQAVEIIGATEGLPFGCSVDVKAFHRLDPEAQIGLRDPYIMSLQMCLHGAVVHAMFEPPEDKVTVILDSSVDWAGDLPKLMKMMAETHGFGPRLGAYGFGQWRDLLPLQAADFVAYEATHYLENQVKRPHLKMTWPLQQIVAMAVKEYGVHWFQVYDEERLRFEEGRVLRALARTRREMGIERDTDSKAG
jgi:hypothetical protein